MIVEGSDEGENGPNLEVGTHFETRPQATPLNHHGKDLDTPKVEINLANNNGLLRPLSIHKVGKATQQARACGIIELAVEEKQRTIIIGNLLAHKQETFRGRNQSSKVSHTAIATFV